MMGAAAQLWAGLHCPALPLMAVWQVMSIDGPLAVHDAVRGQARILQVNALAGQHGARPGQTLSQALAVVPQLQTRPRCRDAEARLLEQMALLAYQHSHQVSLAPPDTVLLEVGGSRRLRGGLQPLLEDLQDQAMASGLALEIGLAPVASAACLLARFGHRVHDGTQLDQTLGELAIEQLMLSVEQHKALRGCGLTQVASILALPAAERARRFGADLNHYLDELRGRVSTPLAQWQPPEAFSLRLELPVPTVRSEALLFVFNRALDTLERWLEIRDRGLSRLRVRMEREDGGPASRFDIGLARPGFDRARLLELIQLKLDQTAPGGDIDAVKLDADSSSERRPAQSDLLSGINRNDAWPALLDRLEARLGTAGISSLAPTADHRPEHAWTWVPPGTSSPCRETRPRPSWLLPEPQGCRREQLALEDGPERIESGWWEGQDCLRDYWIARDRQGRQLWVFHEHHPRKGWFIHGVFG
ncbi:MAG: DNA polymerase Y family protein [Pseudomonadota bacterium]